MRLNILALALAASAFTFAANAETAVIEEHRDPAVVVEHRDPAVVIKHKKIETTGSGDCVTRTVHKEGLAGSKTVKKTKCD